MSERDRDGSGRREFLRTLAVLGVSGLVLRPDAGAAGGEASEDAPQVHNMLVLGERTVFLSHLPMFVAVNQSGTEFTSPHRYQVILEATFTKGSKNVQDLYFSDRKANPRTRIYTLNPESFVLPHLFTPDAERPRMTSFTAVVFRGHLEQGGQELAGLENTTVKVTRVVHARKFDPRVRKPELIEYILFGKSSELFLAHAIFQPPDFDHVLSVNVDGRDLTEKELSQDLRVTLPDRKNAAAQRLREGQQASGTLRAATAGGTASPIKLQAGVEFYFEEGELMVPHTFEPTAEEKKANLP